MTIVFIAAIVILIIIAFRKNPKKKLSKDKTAQASDIVNVRHETAGNTTTFTIELNEKEFVKQLKNGSLKPSGKRDLSVEDIAGFYGQATHSKNRLYHVVAADSYYNNDKLINGQIALIKGGKLLFKKKLQRPNDAHVSNTGIVICCDWLHTDSLAGKFMAFDQAGELLFDRKTTANLGTCAISENGIYALFETYGSETADSDQIFVVDISEKKIIAQFERMFAFNDATINESEKLIRFKNHEGLVYEVDFKGNQTNRTEYERQILTEGSVYVKMRFYEEKTEQEKFSDPYYLQLLEFALADQNASYSFGMDRIYRKIGEYYEANGQLEKTIEFWERAIEVNSKVGVARRLESAKKKIQP